jgi:predicted component of type VI protein secretion system
MDVKLVVIGGKNEGREIPIAEPEFIIGRAEECQLRPASDRVSRKHCVIRCQEGRVTVTDLKSTNHTYVNGEQITGQRELKNGDKLKVGVLEFEVQLAVSVGGKTKPKVHSIQEAAARTVESTTSKEDDLDIAGWLEEEEEKEEKKTTNPPNMSDTMTLKDTHTIQHKLADTTPIPMPGKDGEQKKKEEKKAPKPVGGQFNRPKKPVSDNSYDAATDTLRQFFNRKK